MKREPNESVKRAIAQLQATGDIRIVKPSENGRSVVLELSPYEAQRILNALDSKYATEEAITVHSRGTLERLIHWWDALRPGDSLSMSSAHNIGGVIGEARGLLKALQRIRKENNQ